MGELIEKSMNRTEGVDGGDKPSSIFYTHSGGRANHGVNPFFFSLVPSPPTTTLVVVFVYAMLWCKHGHLFVSDRSSTKFGGD